jgi:hypothetical protein
VKLELFKLAEPIVPHYHKVQRQFILVVEGKLNAVCGDEAPVAFGKAIKITSFEKFQSQV